MRIDSKQELFVIELRITIPDGRSSFQLCGTAFSREAAEDSVKRLPHPEGHEFSIVKYVPATS